MNAMTLPRPDFGQTLARGWTLFWRSADTGTRWTVLGFSVFFLAVALLKGATPSLYPLALGVWWMWVPRIALVHREARLEHLPHAGHVLAVALLIACVPMLAAYLWSGNALTFGIAVFWAALVLAVSMMSTRLIMVAYLTTLFVIVPVVAIVAHLAGIDAHAQLKAAIGGTPATGIIVSLTVAAVLGAVVMWRRFVRRDIAVGERIWSKPLVMMTAAGMRNAQAGGDWWTGMPLSSWILKETRVHTGPMSGLTAIRRWIGYPFMPHTRRQQIARIAAFVFFIGFLASLLRDNVQAGEHTDLVPVIMGAVTVVFWMYVQRLHQFMQRPTGELSELALLPGLGNADNARMLLLRAVSTTMRHEYVAVLAMTALLLAALWYGHVIAPAQVAGMALTVVEVLLLIHCATLAMLCGIRLRFGWREVLVATVALAIPTTTLTLFGGADAPHWRWLLVAGCVVLAAGGALIGWLHRRYRRRTHPFLQH